MKIADLPHCTQLGESFVCQQPVHPPHLKDLESHTVTYKVSGGLFLQVDCDIQPEHNQDNVKEGFTNRFWNGSHEVRNILSTCKSSRVNFSYKSVPGLADRKLKFYKVASPNYCQNLIKIFPEKSTCLQQRREWIVDIFTRNKFKWINSGLSVCVTFMKGAQ